MPPSRYPTTSGTETIGHPPHAERPTAAAAPSLPAPRRGRRVRFAAVLLTAGLAFGTAGCLAPGGAPPGPSPDVANAIQAAFGDLGPGTVSCMTNVAFRESHWDPAARNASGASGLFQLMLPLHDDLFWALGVNPDQAWGVASWNARAARELYDSSGIAPWRSC